MGTVAEPQVSATQEQPLAANLGWLLAQAAHTLNTELTAALERLFVSPRAYCVLSSAMSGEYTQTEIAQMVGLDKTTMVVTLDQLEADGLAKRVPSSEDRRARVVAVTKAGKRKVVEAEKIVDQIHADVLAALPAGQRKQFLESLTCLVGGRLSEPVQCSQPVRRRS
jgi:MarR family transcriptional regulator, transcriptional regulator for hemolysin